ncbi:uncharacterized protein [Lolium perenne]|uniref:uncharacterized protein n=1 Tax=Lolium perenne TaxID=4522 RepID=UPI0021F67AD0|nr:uncharacterized protein LOC127303131 [Lolium perenne]
MAPDTDQHGSPFSRPFTSGSEKGSTQIAGCCAAGPIAGKQIPPPSATASQDSRSAMASNSNVGSAAGGGGQSARNWSMYGLIHSITRNRLNPGRADDLVYVHQKLRLISKRSANSIGKKRAAPLQLTSFFWQTTISRNVSPYPRRYRMSRDLFWVILRGVRNYDPYFQCRPDATGAIGFTSYQKCSAAICMLSYGMAADIFDEYLRMGESTCLETMYRFYRAVIDVFGEYYCREPTVEDTRRLLCINESRGFPGMIGIIDCMH